MTRKCRRSKCCNAKVKTVGTPDFIGDKVGCTFHYSCTECKNACDIKEVLIKHERALPTKKNRREKNPSKIVTPIINAKEEIFNIKRRIKHTEKELKFRAKIIQKIFDLFEGITINPVKGVILTPDKMRQLNELYKMDQELFRMQVQRPR
ncbi:MAG: hypothetical protein Q8L47_02795 [bacterium]|nr:hypothetical protein [bacterium]